MAEDALKIISLVFKMPTRTRGPIMDMTPSSLIDLPMG
jgi:hypothetical protein